MKANSVSSTPPQDAPSSAVTPSEDAGPNFAQSLESARLEYAAPQAPASAQQASGVPIAAGHAPIDQEAVRTGRTTPANAATAYTRQMKSVVPPESMSSYEKYKDDQLLRNPGGRNYFLDRKEVIANPPEKRSFFGRIGKDISDSFGNLANFAGNIFLGSKFLYRDENGAIQEGRQRGLLGTLVNFVKDLGSALSFGAWHPDREEAPKGFKDRLFYSASKLKDAIWNDLVEGIPASVNHMGKNLMLAGWHLAEVLPDASIANFDAGEKLTTNIFDNGHVMVEYLTDVLPSGDAWFRVHAATLRPFHPPVLYNLSLPERFSGDTRWEYVRNTPFRKSIETIGALLGDGLAMGMIGQTGLSGNRNKKSY